jgi:hypothetical protein
MKESTVIPKALNQPVLNMCLYTHNHAIGATINAKSIDAMPILSISKSEPITIAKYSNGAIRLASMAVVNLILPIVSTLAEMYTGMDSIIQATITTAKDSMIAINPKPISVIISVICLI